MAKKSTIIELRKMQLPDLEREIRAKRMHLAKVHMGVEMRQEKDTAKVRFERRELARFLTALGEKQRAGALKKGDTTATMPVPAAVKAVRKSAPKAKAKSSSSKK